MSIPEARWREAAAALDAAGPVVLACHEGPDGDALGSMLALRLALERRGTPAIASWGSDPVVVPRRFAFLPGQDGLVPPRDVPPAPDVMVTFDCASPERLGLLEPNARAARVLVVVDHHPPGGGFGTINLVDPEAAASAVIVHRLLREAGLPVDREVATCLYTGIVTDTGSFKYRSTTPEVHRIAAELLACGVPHDEVARRLYDTHPLGYLRVLAAALERVELVPEASLVWTAVTRRDLECAGIGLEDTEPLIDVVRTAEEAEVACVLKELEDGAWRVSLRSKGRVAVGPVCEALGGGGHALAAAFTARDGDPRGIVARVVERLVAPAAT
jgi:phosphoesterase RecJ-like protein